MLGNTSLILGKDGKLYAVGAKEVLIFNEKDSEKNKILKWRCRIPSQKKMIYIALNYKNASAIANDGLGYALEIIQSVKSQITHLHFSLNEHKWHYLVNANVLFNVG